MALNGRQREVLELVRRRGFVAIEELAQTFQVTTQTVRRDINQLCGLQLLQRYHGGAGLPSSVENLAYSTRQVLQAAEKERLARRLAEEIPDHASLFINIGTTTEAVARSLLNHRGLRVVTNNLNVAVTLSRNPEFDVIVTGGAVRARDQGIIGEATVDFIRQFKLDYGIIGISAIDADGTLLDYDYREVRVAQAIIANSRRVFLAADHTKFQRSAMVRLGEIAEIAAFFTDRPPPEPIAELMRQRGVEIFVAEAARGAAAAE